MKLITHKGRSSLALINLLFIGSLMSNANAQECPQENLPDISTVAVPMHPDDAAQTSIDRLKYRGGIHLQHDDERFGAFSGSHITEDGSTLTAVGGGVWMRGELTYDESGDLSGFEIECFDSLGDEQGNSLSRQEDMDAEALAFDGEEFLVGFETELRVWAYRDLSGPARDVSLPDYMPTAVPTGAGYSSLASDSPGTFYLMTEGGRSGENRWKGYFRQATGSGRFWIQKYGRDPFLPVGLAVMPDGNLILGEIATVTEGETAAYRRLRISTLYVAGLAHDSVLTPVPVAALGPPLIGEKYETIESHRGPNGETLIYIMSDDGFQDTEATMIRMYELLPAPTVPQDLPDQTRITLSPTGEIQVDGEFILIIDGTDPEIQGNGLVSDGGRLTVENGVSVRTGSFIVESNGDASFTPGSETSRTILMEDAVIAPAQQR